MSLSLKSATVIVALDTAQMVLRRYWLTPTAPLFVTLVQVTVELEVGVSLAIRIEKSSFPAPAMEGFLNVALEPVLELAGGAEIVTELMTASRLTD